MVVVYILSPILIMLLGIMWGAPIFFPVQEKLALKMCDEDKTLLIIRSEFVQDKLTLEQYELAVERALNGASFMQAIEGMELSYNKRRPLMATRPEELGEYRYG